VAGRVDVDPEPVLPARQPLRAERQHLPLGLVDVLDADVEVELLRVGRIGPARRPVVGGVLEAQAAGIASTLVIGMPSSSE
jgi:hypothetical protein